MFSNRYVNKISPSFCLWLNKNIDFCHKIETVCTIFHRLVKVAPESKSLICTKQGAVYKRLIFLWGYIQINLSQPYSIPKLPLRMLSK